MPKRKRDDASSSSDDIIDLTGDSDDDADEVESIPAPPKRQAVAAPSSGISTATMIFNGNGFYLNALSYPPSGCSWRNSLLLEQILDLANLKGAFFSSYCLDWYWFSGILSRLPTDSCSITLCKHWSYYEEKYGKFFAYIQTYSRQKVPVAIVHPKLDRFSNMHSKIMLLEFDGFLRVVVSSANLSPADWLMYSYVIWIQDFPVKASSAPLYSSTDSFSAQLVDLWWHLTLGLPSTWLLKYDFSGTKVHLVSSIPGYHKGNALYKYGHMRLRSLLASSNSGAAGQSASSASSSVASSGRIPADTPMYFQTSSIGDIKNDWLTGFAQSVGVDPARASKLVNIVYPSYQTVAASSNGTIGAGMVFLKKQYFENPSFPKQILAELNSKDVQQQQHVAGKHPLLHSKLACRLCKDTYNNRISGWMYLGSHNFTPAALGRLQKDDTYLYIINYETGVVFKFDYSSNPIELGTRVADGRSDSSTVVTNADLDAARGWHLPLPFAIPTRKYRDGDYPWMTEYYY